MKKIKFTIILTIILSLIFTTLLGGTQFLSGVSPLLIPGSKGIYVEQLQQRLQNWGYYEGVVDGNYNWATFMAVKNFQADYGLAASGFANQQTQIAAGMALIRETGTAYAQGKGVGNEQLLARAINGEARGEPYVGQVAVGAVIINRTRDPRFPKTISGVIYQPRAFTAVDDGQINVPIDPKSTVVKAARDALNGFDPTNGCVYYFNPATATSKWIWSRTIVKKIGKHNFAK